MLKQSFDAIKMSTRQFHYSDRRIALIPQLGLGLNACQRPVPLCSDKLSSDDNVPTCNLQSPTILHRNIYSSQSHAAYDKGFSSVTPNISIYEMSDVTTEDRKRRRSPTVQNVLRLPKLPRYTRLLMQGKQDMRSKNCEKRKT